ncbi:DUF1573 domain-containing protein [Flammeovirga pacifica]|uniref:DUF1573 domain-containing protein n=1 Tax=Flammeovirga pacifica TaxID=915059 RepID=A0A1S1YY23_FLAPC|nr:DUF1573 domain-containing protein [Flammeovirga pacifica]OHX65898.1 hypothetical protein NH26_05795 [Flammeovirga pacifica]
MREKYFIRFIIIFFVCCLTKLQAQKRDGVLRFANQKIDLGNVQAGQNYQIIIPFVNIGNSEVNILKVDTDCGCSDAYVNHQKIVKGDTAHLNITFIPVEGETPFYKNIVMLSDGKISHYTIILQGNVSDDANQHGQEPIKVNWATQQKSVPILSNYQYTIKSQKGEDITVPLYVTNVGEKTLHIKSISSNTLELQPIQLPRSVMKGEVLSFPINTKMIDKDKFQHYIKLLTDEKSILIRLRNDYIE